MTYVNPAPDLNPSPSLFPGVASASSFTPPVSWESLIADVRAQIDVSPEQAYTWLLERARVLNVEAAWLVADITIPAATGQTEYPLPRDCVRVEAVGVGGGIYRRSTFTQYDQAREGHGTARIYADAAETLDHVFAIWPPGQTGAQIVVRYLADVPNDPAGGPPFPSDISPILADGAIGQGLARMDERFDSAAYFEARFNDGVARLKRRRHGRVGRGGTQIRLAG